MIDPYSKGKQPLIMVWAAINLHVKKSLLVALERDLDSKGHGYTANSYIKVLEEGLLPVIEEGDLYQQDNARIHTARKTMEWLEENGIDTIDWPAYSPDLNPIEHIWAKLKELVYKLHPELIEQKQRGGEVPTLLLDALQDGWKALPEDFITSCIESVPRRLQAVIDAQGWYTRY